MNAKEKITKARTRLILDQYFFGSLAMRLVLEENESFQTASTDGHSLCYNPSFIDSLSMQETIGLLAHEVMHCALDHVRRGEGKDGMLWNMAADYTINENLRNAGFSLPQGGLFDTNFHGMATEEIYHQLRQQKQQGGGGQGKEGQQGNGKQQASSPQNDPNSQDPGKCGGVHQNPNLSKEERQQLAEEWKGATAQAAQMCKNKGDLPNEIRLQIKELIDPPLPWHVLLRDFVERCAKNDYNWTRPNRRYISEGIILPSLLSEVLPEMVIANDTSGSTMGVQDEFAREASGVLSSYKTTVRVIYCDAAVHGEEVYETEDLPIKLKPIGGGGTSFVPVFDYIEKMGYMPACLIFLTDLYGTFPSRPPEYPVMWITPNDQKAPFGTTIKFTKKVEK